MRLQSRVSFKYIRWLRMKEALNWAALNQNPNPNPAPTEPQRGPTEKPNEVEPPSVPEKTPFHPPQDPPSIVPPTPLKPPGQGKALLFN